MKRLLSVAAIVLLIGAIAVPVMAQGPGWGRGGHMMYGWGGGPGDRPYYGRGYSALTPEQQEQLDTVYKKFYNETNQIRNELWTKRAELNEALNAANPDTEKAKAIQKEISDLRAQLDQKRIDLALEERKINPDGAGYGRGYGMGYGRHMWGQGFGPGSGWKKGGFGPGYCWN